MQFKKLTIPYTICFCTKDDKVLMIKRNKQPHLGKLNGIGGKIETGEHPLNAVKREIKEEADIDLKPDNIKYVGLVTWGKATVQSNDHQGMYAFVADASSQTVAWQNRDIYEGKLEWKKISEVSDKDNLEVAPNVPHFLPQMLTSSEPALYHCVFENRIFLEVIIKRLPSEYLLVSPE